MDATNVLAQRLLDALPQTQCQRCGYPDCAAYASAIANDSAPINQCPPGGAQGVQRLANITGQTPLALNPQFGQEQERTVVYIDEDWCIGCTLCIKACPVDAIVGSNKWMHTVIESACTGCELCIPACPVDCIEIEIATPGKTGWDAWSPADAKLARERYEFHSVLRSDGIVETLIKPENSVSGASSDTGTTGEQTTQKSAKKRLVIENALARARSQSPTRRF